MTLQLPSPSLPLATSGAYAPPPTFNRILYRFLLWDPAAAVWRLLPEDVAAFPDKRAAKDWQGMQAYPEDLLLVVYQEGYVVAEEG